jgi:hypothetical protein
MQESRRHEHGAEDRGGNRAYSAGRDEARPLLEEARCRRVCHVKGTLNDKTASEPSREGIYIVCQICQP